MLAPANKTTLLQVICACFLRQKIFILLMKVSKCVPCLCLCTINKHSTANNQISQSNEVLLDSLVCQQYSHFISKKVLEYNNFFWFVLLNVTFLSYLFIYFFFFYLFHYTPILICASVWKQPLAGAFIVL